MVPAGIKFNSFSHSQKTILFNHHNEQVYDSFVRNDKRLSASEQTDLLDFTLKDDNQTGIIKGINFMRLKCV